MACLHKSGDYCSECSPYMATSGMSNGHTHCYCLDGTVANVPHVFCCKCGDRVRNIPHLTFTTNADNFKLYCNTTATNTIQTR